MSDRTAELTRQNSLLQARITELEADLESQRLRSRQQANRIEQLSQDQQQLHASVIAYKSRNQTILLELRESLEAKQTQNDLLAAHLIAEREARAKSEALLVDKNQQVIELMNQLRQKQDLLTRHFELQAKMGAVRSLWDGHKQAQV